jgi:GNAT superfamily N-acetyltransferase
MTAADSTIYVRLMANVEGIEYRPMVASDVGSVPIVHQGDRGQVLARIAELGSSAVLAFEGDQHVAQLQFRRYEPGTRSPNGVWDPLYWMDFGDHAPKVPPPALCVCCYHVGQVNDTADRDARYQDRGIGPQLLDHLVEWARAAGVGAVIAKATPPYRPVMQFLGGLPTAVYEARKFEIAARWVDADLETVIRERHLVTPRRSRTPQQWPAAFFSSQGKRRRDGGQHAASNQGSEHAAHAHRTPTAEQTNRDT